MPDASRWGLPHRLGAFPASDPRLAANGRTTFASDGGLELHYGGSGIRGEFQGRTFLVLAEAFPGDHRQSLGLRIDGSPEMRIDLAGPGRQVYTGAVALDRGLHRFELYRRSDCWRGTIRVSALLLDPGCELGDPPRPGRRKIAFYGDSILAGGSVEAVGFEGMPDDAMASWNPNDDLTNGWLGFGAVASRSLDGDSQVNGIGGLALLNGTGWYGLPNAVGLESTWDKACPVIGRMTPWDFSLFQPRLIVCSIGQNDAKDGDIHDPGHAERWRTTYLRILASLSKVQPEAQFLLTTTLMHHDREWDSQIDEVASLARAAGLPVRTHHFRREGQGSPGHLRVLEEEEMGLELADAILAMDIGWGS